MHPSRTRMVVATGVASCVMTWPLTSSRSDIASHRRRGQTFRHRADGAAERVESFPQHVLWHRERRQQSNAVAEEAGAHDHDAVLYRLTDNLQRLVGSNG